MRPENPYFNEIIDHRASVKERKEIKAPEGYVSVFHETSAEVIPSIDSHGLLIGQEKNLTDERMHKRNQLIDMYRPERIKQLGISRNNIFAYPYLEHGHGLYGATERYTKLHSSEEDLRILYGGRTFESMRQTWEPYGIHSEDELVAKFKDPKFLRELVPEGEVLELKVDPKKCFVGDMEYITRIQEDIHRHGSEAEAVENQAKSYWENLVSLDDFLKWYRKPQYDGESGNFINVEQFKQEPSFTLFCVLKGAPDELPMHIEIPEIMIPEDIPQEHIKVLE